MSYYLAHSLVRLRDEIDARWPDRDKASDGWIGDTSHSARKSDHNPDWDAGGVVRAIDIDKDGIDVQAVLDAALGDPRVWYVIFDRKIYSRTYGWEARDYTGSNPHDKHIHVSLLHTKAAETDTTRWLALPQKPRRKTRGPRIDRALNGLSRATRVAENKGRSRRAKVIQSAIDALHRLKARRK